MLEDLDNRKVAFFKGKEKNPSGKGKRAGKDGAKPPGQADSQKIQGQCWNCGKTGHQSKDCWARPQRCERQVWQRWRKERQVSRCWMENLPGISSLEAQLRARWVCRSTTVGTIDKIECTALDLCATTMAQQEVANPRWRAFNVDTWSWRNCVADER